MRIGALSIRADGSTSDHWLLEIDRDLWICVARAVDQGEAAELRRSYHASKAQLGSRSWAAHRVTLSTGEIVGVEPGFLNRAVPV